MDVIESLIVGHRDVFEKKDLLAKLAKNINNDAFFWDNAPKVWDFFNKEVSRHFMVEEKALFPVLKKVIPPEAKKTLEKIEDEHGPILEKVKELKAALVKHQEGSTKSTREELTRIAGDLIGALVPHAQAEDEKIFPLIKKYFKTEHYAMLEEEYIKLS